MRRKNSRHAANHQHKLQPLQTPKQDFLWEEVGKHRSTDDLWLVIDGSVYDATHFINEHPGGLAPLKSKAGKDATKQFHKVGHSERAKNQFLPKYCIGRIDPESDPEEWQKCDSTARRDSFVAIVLACAIATTMLFLII